MSDKHVDFRMTLKGDNVDQIDPFKLYRELDEKYDVELTFFSVSRYEYDDGN